MYSIGAERKKSLGWHLALLNVVLISWLSCTIEPSQSGPDEREEKGVGVRDNHDDVPS